MDLSYFLDVDEKAYILVDDSAEKKFQFSLQESLRRAHEKKLLASKKVFVTPKIEPEPKDMKELVEASGGEVTF